jgi:NarL family two-component system response regulator LiaR
VTEPFSVVIVDDHAEVRSGLRAYLASQPGFNVVGEAASSEAAISLATKHTPDVMLMDLLLPAFDGVEAMREIKKISPGTQIIVLTSSNDDERIFSALKAGASGCIFKDMMKMENITDAIRKGILAELSIHPRIAVLILKNYQWSESSIDDSAHMLTELEFKILNLLAKGYSIRKISDRISISDSKVNGHLRKILTKLQNADCGQTAAN